MGETDISLIPFQLRNLVRPIGFVPIQICLVPPFQRGIRYCSPFEKGGPGDFSKYAVITLRLFMLEPILAW